MSPASPHRPQTDPPTLTLRGAWTGRVGDPQREFRGQISDDYADAAHPDAAHPDAGHPKAGHLRAGSPVSVVYQAAQQRAPGPDQHGTYLLHAGNQTLPLMSFTCQATVTTGPHGHDDTQEATWQAVPLP